MLLVVLPAPLLLPGNIGMIILFFKSQGVAHSYDLEMQRQEEAGFKDI